MSNPAPPALREEEVREAVNRWSTGFFRIPYLGDKMFLDQIVAHRAYTVRLQTQYEERTLSRQSEPYGGGTVDDRGVPPGPWDLPARRPTDFEERTEKLRVPHTEQVGMCSRCAGLGRIDCQPCNGTGRANCTWCHGKGYREEMELRSGTDAQGNQRTGHVSVRKDCTHCHQGKVTCNSCNGNGRVTCSSCQGSGRVKTYDLLTVHFHCPTRLEVVDPSAAPDDLLRKLSGEELYDEQLPRIENCPDLPEEAARCVRGLLDKSHALDEAKTRLLFQHLHVERVPVHEVKYRYAGVSYELWICGDERQVHAPRAPWRTGRLWSILGSVALGVVVVVVVILGLVMAFGG